MLWHGQTLPQGMEQIQQGRFPRWLERQRKEDEMEALLCALIVVATLGFVCWRCHKTPNTAGPNAEKITLNNDLQAAAWARELKTL
jgi:hypothetical protein